ncbi:hypothetical protein BGZ96_003035 [Linnemannia gamsii]|uniref:non-specific serine/threonine protein kinase n=1 Tax=Linnemannia gamsii TaxID=64522 RepID=A0ABQ7JK73_9FUNG|nr:hypothetical protein BGZ96_003035 [Linnemannia gamsii]
MVLSLNHEYIVRAHGNFEVMDLTVLVQDLCQGGDLHGKLAETKVLGMPEDEVARWMLQVLEVFDYLYGEMGLVHRDLKPENIVLDGEGNAKVVDFGFSFYLSEGCQMAGAPGYWTPEVEAFKEYGKEIDVFSFEVMIRRLLRCTGFSVAPASPLHRPKGEKLCDENEHSGSEGGRRLHERELK